MSIIIEALKKTQTDFKKKETRAAVLAPVSWPSLGLPQEPVFPTARKSDPPASSVPDKAALKPRSKNWYAVVLLEICAFGIIAAILFIFQPRLFLQLSPPAAPPSSAAVKPLPSPPTAPSAPSVTTPRKIKIPSLPSPAKESLILNGIMMVGEKKVALINDEPHEVGDYVDGKKITAITLERVELLDGKETEILSVRPAKRR